MSLDKVKADALFDSELQHSSPMEIVENLVVPALVNIGQSWQEGDLALSQIYMSGRFCEEIVDRVLPPSDPDRKNQPRSAIVVLNDFHMLGKRIVYSMMRASGYEIFDYGRMEINELVPRVKADKIRVLLVSVLMLPSALRILDLRSALNTESLDVKILVGGAPFLFDSQLWENVGADAMGATASDAVQIVGQWMEEMS
ncbi:MAG: cobalamin-dependent protein [Candidatus Thiodiazotropha taylori]|nr:cobalamin-dependent protein [Candidatus Thiodiazotropha taylori]